MTDKDDQATLDLVTSILGGPVDNLCSHGFDSPHSYAPTNPVTGETYDINMHCDGKPVGYIVNPSDLTSLP